MMTTRRHIRGAAIVALVLSTVLGGWHPAWADERVLVIHGRGWGHGVGMSQEGARTMGAAGASTDEILAKFYPGTTKGSAQATLRVLVLESGRRSETFAFPGGGEVRATPSGPQPAGFPVAVAPGGSVEVSRDTTGYRVAATGGGEAVAGAHPVPLRLISAESAASSTVPGPPPPTTSTTAAPTTTTAVAPATTTSTPATPAPTTTPSSSSTVTPPAAPPPPPAATNADAPSAPTAPGPLWAVPRSGATTVVSSRGRRYRGAVEVGAGATRTLRLVNHVDVESYLRGMGEVLDPAWPPAALRAQAIAARTYALRTAADSELCDDDRCQVYLGQSAEYPAMDRAVSDSRGQVLRFGGALASTFYSANGGGISATAEEGFGSNGVAYPYLPSAPYPTADPDPWTNRARLAEVGSRMGYPGELRDARITRTGPSGRAAEITLDGDAGPMPVGGRVFAARLGLKSTLIELRSDVGPASALPEVTVTPAVDQDPGTVRDAALGVASSAVAIEVPPAPSPRSWARQQLPPLLMLLVADMAVMSFRRRRRDAMGAQPLLLQVM